MGLNALTKSSDAFRGGMRVHGGRVNVAGVVVSSVGGDVVEAQQLSTGIDPFYRVTLPFALDRSRNDVVIVATWYDEGAIPHVVSETKQVDVGGDVRDDLRDLDFFVAQASIGLPATATGTISFVILKGR